MHFSLNVTDLTIVPWTRAVNGHKMLLQIRPDDFNGKTIRYPGQINLIGGQVRDDTDATVLDAVARECATRLNLTIEANAVEAVMYYRHDWTDGGSCDEDLVVAVEVPPETITNLNPPSASGQIIWVRPELVEAIAPHLAFNQHVVIPSVLGYIRAH